MSFKGSFRKQLHYKGQSVADNTKTKPEYKQTRQKRAGVEKIRFRQHFSVTDRFLLLLGRSG